jgi:hypothetical protein
LPPDSFTNVSVRDVSVKVPDGDEGLAAAAGPARTIVASAAASTATRVS